MSFSVFLSYSSKDMARVDQVRRSLVGLPVNLFIADHSVEPGESLPVKILAAIKECDLFIVLWSKNSQQSQWVAQEVGAARSSGKPVVPVVSDASVQLPAFLQDLKYLSLQSEPGAALSWLRQHVNSRATNKSSQQAALGWAVVGIIALLALSESK